MKKLSLPKISMEAISYQGRSLLFFDLVSIIEVIRTHPLREITSDGYPHANLPQDLVDRSGMADVIFRRTGIRVMLFVNDDFSDYSCYAEPPIVDVTNPYYKLIDGAMSSKGDLAARHQRAIRLAEDTVGWVDLKASRVGGLFSSMINRVFLSQILFADRDFTSEEVAGVLLHELGHIFSFFETMAYNTASNMVITTAVEALRGEENQKTRIRLISQSLSLFGKPDTELLDTLYETKDETVIHSMMLKSMEDVEQVRTKTLAADPSHSPYNTRSIEYMADQFAIRHGAGLAIASAKHKLAKIHTVDYGRSKAGFYAIQAARISLLVVTAYFSLPVAVLLGTVVTLIGTSAAAGNDHYGDPSEHLGRIKSDMVQLLKNPRMDAKLRKQILKDVEALDALRAEVKEHGGIFRYLYRNLIPMGRRRAKAREFQKGLEDLINNDLYIQAQQLAGR